MALNFLYTEKRRPKTIMPEGYVAFVCKETGKLFGFVPHHLNDTVKCFSEESTYEEVKDFVRFVENYRPELCRTISLMVRDFTNTVKAAMYDQGISIEQLAEARGRSFQNVLGVISGKHTEQHSFKEIETYCELLHIKVTFTYES